MTRNQKMKNKILEIIPRELVTNIVSKVGASSVRDLSHVKLSCKKLNEIGEEPYVYQHACMDKFPISQWKYTQSQQDFLNKCIQSSHPELLYRQALVDFFDNANCVSACQKLRKATELGYPPALYATAIVSLLSGDEERKKEGLELIGSINKSAMGAFRGKLVENLKPLWLKNPVLKNPPTFCEAHRWRNGWIVGKEGVGCEGCVADEEFKFVSFWW